MYKDQGKKFHNILIITGPGDTINMLMKALNIEKDFFDVQPFVPSPEAYKYGPAERSKWERAHWGYYGLPLLLKYELKTPPCETHDEISSVLRVEYITYEGRGEKTLAEIARQTPRLSMRHGSITLGEGPDHTLPKYSEYAHGASVAPKGAADPFYKNCLSMTELLWCTWREHYRKNFEDLGKAILADAVATTHKGVKHEMVPGSTESVVAKLESHRETVIGDADAKT